MKSMTNASHVIAIQAIDQLAAAAQTIAQLEALFRVILTTLDENTDAARLVAIGEYTAMDQSRCFLNESEKLEENLADAEKRAPQNGESKNVARNSEVQS